MNYSSQRFLDDSQAYEVSFDGVDAILGSTMKAIDAKWLASLEIPLATDMAMLKISKMIAWAQLVHDGELDASNPNFLLEFMQPDPEPAKPMIDTWARGTVPVRKMEETSQPDYKLSKEKKEGDKTPSDGGSFRTSNSGTAKTSNSRISRVTASAGAGRKANSAVEEEDPTGQIVDLDDPDEDFSDLNGNGELFEMLKQRKKNKGGDDSEGVEPTKSEFELLQAGIEKQLAEMKIKKFAVDATGKVIPLQPVRPDTLPPFAVPLDTKITSPRAGTGKKIANEGGGGDRRKKKVIRVAGSRTLDDDDSLFVASNTLATVLSTGEAIAPQPGVALRVGNNMREGPSVPEDPAKMSRKNYLARSMTNAGGGDASRAQTGAGSPGGDLEGTGLKVGFADSGFMSPTPGGLPQSMMGAHSVKLTDVDRFEGGRRLLTQEELLALQTNPTDEELGLGPKNTTGLVQTAVLPLKKDLSVQMFDYRSDKMPKDRDPVINQRPPSDRKHQLAPPVGRVSIRDKKEEALLGGPGSPAGSVASGQSSLASRKGAMLKSTASPSPTKPPEKDRVNPVRPDIARAIV